MKTAELDGPALDWAVAKCEPNDTLTIYFDEETGEPLCHDDWPEDCQTFEPSVCWRHAGPIIEREGITVIRCDDDFGIDEHGFCNNVRIPTWAAVRGQQSTTESTEHQHHAEMFQIYTDEIMPGHSPRVAAMRCYVASKLGNEVDIPYELMENCNETA